MKIVNLMLMVLMSMTAIKAEETPKTRFVNLLTEAKSFTEKFESVNGRDLFVKFELKWKNKLNDGHNPNDVADDILVSKLKDVTDKTKNNKPISADLIYDACLSLLKYEQGELVLPTCFKLVLNDQAACDGIAEMLSSIRKQLEERNITMTKEKDQ